MLKRGLIYETIIFLYALFIAWIIFGDPCKSFLLTAIITITKYPIYFFYHRFYDNHVAK